MNRYLDIPYRHAEGSARISLYDIRQEDQIFSYHSEQIWTHFHVGRLWRMITERPSLYEAMSVTPSILDVRVDLMAYLVEEHRKRQNAVRR